MGFRKMRYIVIFSTVFAIFGVVLILGSLLMIAYTVSEPIRVDRSKTWANDTFTLLPSYNRTYLLDSVVKNTSIIQVDVESSDFIVLKIVSDDTGELYVERKGRGTWTSFWTPLKLGYDIWRFVFHNPSSTQVNVTAKITEFYLKVTEYREVTYYHSLFDPLYGYIGIIAIIAGTTLNVIHVSREVKRRNEFMHA